MTAVLPGFWPPWLAGSGGDLTGVVYRSGLYYPSSPSSLNATRGAFAAATNWYDPIVIASVNNGFSAIACNFTALGTGATVQMGVCSDNNGVPGPLLAISGVTAVATPTERPLTPFVPIPGIYWLAWNLPALTTSPTVNVNAGQWSDPHVGNSGNTGAIQGNASGYKCTDGAGENTAWSVGQQPSIAGLAAVAQVPTVVLKAT